MFIAAAAAAAKSLQSYLTLCDPIDGSPPGSPVPGILQARILEWGAIAFSEMFITNTQNSNRDATEKGSLINGFWGQTAFLLLLFSH